MDARLPRRFGVGERVSRRVVLALDALDGPVAVKVADGPDPACSRELAREMERLSSLSHPAFPRPGSFGFLPDGRAWLSMERACGERPAGPCSIADLAAIGDGLCEALLALHARGLLHRDVKSDHVRFDAATGRVMLLDLGTASAPGPSPCRIGTPGFLAPEIAAGRGGDERSDLYGLGAVLYEIASGRPAHAGDPVAMLKAQRDGVHASLAALRGDLPAAFTALVERLLSPDPGNRSRDAQELRAELARSLGAVPGSPLGDPPLIGRDRETDALLELADRARKSSIAASLAGPPGSGRSSLLEALRCRLLLQGVPALRVSATRATSMTALARDLALLVDAPLGATPGSPLGELSSAIEGACSAIEGRETMRLPLAILVDDIEAASAELRADLAALVTALPPGVLLVVVDGPRGESLGTSLPCRVDLGPLPESAIQRLLAARLRGAPSDEILGRALAGSRQPAAILASTRPQPLAPLPRIACDDADPLALLRAGRIAAAVAAWQARQLALPAGFEGERARALAGLGLALWAMAEPADALARAEAALALAAEGADPEAEAKAARVLGRIYGAFGSTRDAVGWQRRALEIAAEQDGVPRAEALSELGLLMIREGHVEAALRALAESVRDATADGDAGSAALSRARLGRARLVSGDLGGADRLLRRAVGEARGAGERLVEIEAMRLLGTAWCTYGSVEDGLAILEQALAAAIDAGFQQEMPALHEALAQGHLRLAVRLRTPTGAIVDRQRLEVARAHVEKGLDLALATGRMADRAALAVLSARCALLVSNARAAQSAADEAHVLALEAGDLLVASQARLVKSEALLDQREYGVALAEARIACEALERSGDLENAWRGHALLARIHGAWGMSAKQAEETQAASRLLRVLEASLRDPRSRRTYTSDVERAAALTPPVTADATKARRGLAPELAGTRFAGRADTEDLVEALIQARERIADLERRGRTSRSVARDARVRRDAMLRAASLATGDGPCESRDLCRVLELVSQACGGARVLLAGTHGGRLRVLGVAGARGSAAAGSHEAALVVARRVVETGRGSLALGAVGHRRNDPPTGDVHVALPLQSEAGSHGALIVRPVPGRALRRADVRLLRGVTSLLSRAVTPEPVEA